MNRADLEALDKATLADLVLRQAERIAALEARLAETGRRFEELERRAARGAAPFARPEGKRSASPKRPGRKGGHAGACRVRPPEEVVDSRIEAPLTHCPRCGDALAPETDETLEQTLIEAPPVRPHVIRLVTHRNRCRRCGRRVASSHPLQVSTAGGAAGTHLGPRALALAASLNKGLGLTMRKTCAVLRDLLGIDLSPGGLAQALARAAGRLAPAYEALLESVKAEPVLHTDETSWWVGRAGFSLWVLTNRAGTCYRVVPARSRAAAEALLGDYRGVLVSDCLNIYDGLTPHQHKCYAHHLKEIGKALDDPGTRDPGIVLPPRAARAARRRHGAQGRDGPPARGRGGAHAPGSGGQRGPAAGAARRRGECRRRRRAGGGEATPQAPQAARPPVHLPRS